ncbi:MAG TPA: hypothetical protein PK106_04910 [Bacteroidales bacterium]|jgi:hypothetical protein|nr:hypothetical protein [Bacteroidales bacterium]
MEKKYFSLEIGKSNRITRTFNLLLGSVCIVLAFAWVVINFDTLVSNRILWLSVIFLLGFGYYQVVTGLGKGDKFIEIGSDSLRIKKNSILPPVSIEAREIAKAEIYPLKLVFRLNSGKSIRMRFGTTFTDIIEPVKESIEDFCTGNKIPLDNIQEEF